VHADTPLGAQLLEVTTPDGAASATAEAAPPAPKIVTVSPDPLVLGTSATVLGEGLDRVTSATLGGVSLTITSQASTLLGLTLPLDPTLLGGQQLVLLSPSGPAGRAVQVAAPVPTIDAIAPNPARIGDLVTVRGAILPVNVSAKVGFADATVVLASPGEVTLHIPEDAEIGPQDIIVRVGAVSSAPEGPLYVQAGATDRPTAAGTYPINVAAGGAVWVVGTHLDTITGATHGLEVVACDKRACRLDTSAAPAGTPLDAALTGPSGAAVFKMQVTDEALVVPVITGITPSPARRGELLTVTGQSLQRTRAAVIGGRSQSISFFDTTTVAFVVHPETPLGAQALFIASNGGSEPFAITVLDPPAVADADPDADVADGGDAGTPDAAPPKKTDDGCASGEATAPWPWLLGVAAAVALTSRRGRRAR